MNSRLLLKQMNSRLLLKQMNSRLLLKEMNSRLLLKEMNRRLLLKAMNSRLLLKEMNRRLLLKTMNSRFLLKEMNQAPAGFSLGSTCWFLAKKHLLVSRNKGKRSLPRKRKALLRLRQILNELTSFIKSRLSPDRTSVVYSFKFNVQSLHTTLGQQELLLAFFPELCTSKKQAQLNGNHNYTGKHSNWKEQYMLLWARQRTELAFLEDEQRREQTLRLELPTSNLKLHRKFAEKVTFLSTQSRGFYPFKRAQLLKHGRKNQGSYNLCGQYGHFARVCPSAGSQQTAAQSQGRGGQSRGRSQQFQQPGPSLFGQSSQPFFSGSQHVQVNAITREQAEETPSRVIGDTPIRSTTRSEIPSSDCTRSPDEISTNGKSTCIDIHRVFQACYLDGTCAWLQPVFQEPGASR
ncbi:hypothetical protein F511_19462 [Dorcoceras hygrometricum]|uniref:CCHC-type domain-containing protein n=1 Tax=Dorcoceras hygrometricum TaxID=472368 RepID=A0A2Z6ZYS3_9LAMI|nr:hypothetical protein F511_19462 [Dorcoceras hygrometricum]